MLPCEAGLSIQNGGSRSPNEEQALQITVRIVFIMRVAVFSTKDYDRQYLGPIAAAAGHELVWLEPRLATDSWPLAAGFPAICVFVNDQLPGSVIRSLASEGLKVIALRCAGFNNVDLEECERHGIAVLRVPAYSPHAVAEHALGMMLGLNRKLHKAYNRVREGNFSLDGLLGFDMHGKTVGVVGTGLIGLTLTRLLAGFGCRLLGFDVQENPACRELGMKYVPLEELMAQSDIVTLHCPLTSTTYRMIDSEAIGRMKRGVMLINTGRGALIDTHAVIQGLKSGQIGALGLDVYEEEAKLFFEDRSSEVIQDDLFMRLLTFPNVLITGHQAFFTREALTSIAEATATNLTSFERGAPLKNQVKAQK